MKRLIIFSVAILAVGLALGYSLSVLKGNTTVESTSRAVAGAFIPISSTTQRDILIAQVATPTLVPMELIDALSAEDEVLINLYQRVNPAVVNIEIAQRTSFYDGVSSSGSGFVYDSEGHIVTNAHVVRDATVIEVTFSDGYITNAEIVGLDEYSDLAVIRVDVPDNRLVPVILGDSSQLLVGQRVVAIGNPFGLQSSMTRGIVSAVGRALPSAQLISQANQRFNNPSIIQTDAAVNPGNSGGPLLNYSGEVIGVNTAIRTESGIFEGVAFAVPSNTIRRVVPQLIETGEAQYSWLGVSTFRNEPGFSVATLSATLNLPVEHGVIIEEVVQGSPADLAGLRGGTQVERIRGVDLIIGGDIIVAINGVFIRDLDQMLGYLVENTSPGDTVTFTVIRDAETLDVDVKLGVRP